MKKQRTALLKLPVSLDYLRGVQVFTEQLAKNAGLGQRETKLLLVALEEAFTNVVRHAFMPDEEASFEIVWEVTGLEFSIRIRDKGLPFSPGQLDTPFTREKPHEISGPGLGFRLMKGAVDAMAFHNLGFDGKEVVLTSFIHQQPIAHYVDASELNAYPQSPPSVKRDHARCLPIRVELLRPEQAIEVSQCAYRTYGYGYIMENVYFPERLFQMTLTGDLVSAVAVCSENNRVMGHCALEFHRQRHGIPEIGMAFVKPEYRGMGCLNKLNDFLMEYAVQKDIKGIYAKAVTTHPHSQKALGRISFHPSGILLAHSPAKRFAEAENGPNQRETLVLHYRKTVPTPAAKIHSPENHLEMIQRIIKQLNIPVAVSPVPATAPSRLPETHCVMATDIRKGLALALMMIRRFGRDFETALHHSLRQLCLQEVAAVNIYLDLADPAASGAVSLLEKSGCFFAGLLPAHPRYFLILQYLNNVTVDYRRIFHYDPFAQELLDYVRGEDPNANIS